MKRILLILCGFISLCTLTQTHSQTLILDLGSEGKWEVMKEDFGKMTWWDALEACDKLNAAEDRLHSEWHIPTKKEMTILFENKDKIGGFKDDVYWTGEQVINQNAAWTIYLENGSFTDGYNDALTAYRYEYYVRAVRYIPPRY
jgi:hypothetical protein